MGDTVNVASRLQGVATSGQILVTQSTYRLTHGIFEFRPLEPIRVKGKKDPLAVFELLEAKTQRNTMRGLEGLISPLVGREWECKVMRKAIAATKLGPQCTYPCLRRCRGGKKPALGGSTILRIRRLHLARRTVLRLYSNPELCPDPRPSQTTNRNH